MTHLAILFFNYARTGDAIYINPVVFLGFTTVNTGYSETLTTVIFAWIAIISVVAGIFFYITKDYFRHKFKKIYRSRKFVTLRKIILNNTRSFIR